MLFWNFDRKKESWKVRKKREKRNVKLSNNTNFEDLSYFPHSINSFLSKKKKIKIKKKKKKWNDITFSFLNFLFFFQGIFYLLKEFLEGGLLESFFSNKWVKNYLDFIILIILKKKKEKKEKKTWGWIDSEIGK